MTNSLQVGTLPFFNVFFQFRKNITRGFWWGFCKRLLRLRASHTHSAYTFLPVAFISGHPDFTTAPSAFAHRGLSFIKSMSTLWWGPLGSARSSQPVNQCSGRICIFTTLSRDKTGSGQQRSEKWAWRHSVECFVAKTTSHLQNSHSRTRRNVSAFIRLLACNLETLVC